jgi:uncharacterized membrane protein YedE/YeeE
MNVGISFFIGLLFGLGLVISKMINPAKVLGFLDIFGNWDPSLALVLGAAVGMSTFGFRIARLRNRPLLAPEFKIPTRTDIDLRLVCGAAIFGVGWGLVGFCPGPSLTALSCGMWQVATFVVAMAAGMYLHAALNSMLGL